jgi:beta-lactamase regulating signal transducer with metallopeptidase domain
MNDALSLILGVNLALAAAVGAVMLLRRPARRLLGARIAYGLWLLAPVAAAAMLTPARVVTLTQVIETPSPAWSAVAVAAAPHAAGSGLDLPSVLAGVWAAGVLICVFHLARGQARFARAARAGLAGPAVVGVLRPRIVTPTDFARRYTPREQAVVLAHERTHIHRRDPLVNALVALARCLAWFNPAIHVLAHGLRMDQELACDAQVIAAHPTVRRSYAEAMLKTQIAARPLPLGCYWPAQAVHPLAERIGLLARPQPGPAGRRLGGSVLALLALGTALGAWTARPARVVLVPVVRPLALETRAPAAAPPTLARPARPAGPAPAKPAPKAPPAQTPDQAVAEAAADALPPPPAPQVSDLAAATRGPPLAAGVFGPTRVRSVAGWSRVAPGSAVRVLATMVDPDGIQLVTDLTAFGSQSWYRLGYVQRNSSRYKLFTSVVQRGDRMLITAGLNRQFDPMVSASTELASGQTGDIVLPNGLHVTVTPTLRAETPEEASLAQRTGERPFVNVTRRDTL